jgi:hypothetical protein
MIISLSAVAAVSASVLLIPGWHGGLRFVSLLVARTPGTWAYRAINAVGLCKALRLCPFNDSMNTRAVARRATPSGRIGLNQSR